MTQFFILFLAALAAIGVGAAGVILYFLKQFQKQVETVEATPLTPVGGLQPGLQKASGTSVALDRTVTSPLTQTECVFYHFKVEELRSGR